MHVLTSLDLVIMKVEQGETRNCTDINSNDKGPLNPVDRKPQSSFTFHVHLWAPLQPIPLVLLKGAPISTPRVPD
jgi:hypothetical protein